MIKPPASSAMFWANACVARGITALVTDGGVRDTREIRELGFPVFSKHVYIEGNRPRNLSARSTIPWSSEKQVILSRWTSSRVTATALSWSAARRLPRQSNSRVARDEAEAGYIERYKRGETPLEVSNLTALLEAKGLVVE